jgi:hypothetical protein
MVVLLIRTMVVASDLAIVARARRIRVGCIGVACHFQLLQPSRRCIQPESHRILTAARGDLPGFWLAVPG